MPDNDHTAAVSLANRLIVRYDIDIPRVSSLRDLPSSFYTTLFQEIFQISIPDLIEAPCNTREEEHNIQSMIDTLSFDVLNVSLSHISGEAVVAGDPTAAYHLLEILLGYAILVTPDFHLENVFLSESVGRNCELCKSNAARLGPIVEKTATDETQWLSRESKREEVILMPSSSKSNSEATIIQDKKTAPKLLEAEETHAKSERTFHFSGNANVTPSRKDENTKHLSTDECRNEFSDSAPDEVPESNRCDRFDRRQTVSTRDQIARSNEHQIHLLTSRLHSIFVKKTKSEKLYDDAIQRQKDHLGLDNRNVAEKINFKLCRADRDGRTKIRSAFGAHSLQRVRTKQYFGKYLQHKTKMVTKDKTSDEVMLVQLLKKRLALQKEELHNLNRDIRQYDQEQYLECQNRIASLENYYEDRLSMIREQQKRRKYEYDVRKKVKEKQMRDVAIENRLKLENDIKRMREDMLRDPFT